MTEYGRGPGSEPWHPEDPLYGDGGWGGQQAQAAQQPPYGGLPQTYPQEPQQQAQQVQYDEWGRPVGYQQQYPDQYDPNHYGVPQDQQYADHLQQQQPQQPQPYQQGGWDGHGTHAHVPYAADPGDPYGQQPAAYGVEQPDQYGTSEAYPPPQPPQHRQPEAEPVPAPTPEPEPKTDWDPGPDQGEHAFFADDPDEDDGYDDDPGADDPKGRKGRGKGEGRNKREGKKKRRNGCACLVVVVVFGGGLGGVGYVGYHYYQNRFGAAPDYAGSGNGQLVTVVIDKGSFGSTIGQKLKEAGVVKSVDAFVTAQNKNPSGKTIQDGVYTLQKEMSAASAVELMLSPKSKDNLVVAEGRRNAAVYALIDKRLKVPDGTTAGVAEKEYKSLGLPSWALNQPDVKDPLEGFLYPSSYGVAKGQKPEAVLKSMVSRANDKYRAMGLEKKAEALGLDGPWQLLTVASLVQAEGKTHDDFRKMAEVVYNRLKPTNHETNQLLQFDSTFNYLKGQSNINISESEINSNKDPYNTYTRKGLPPGPISNPGDQALAAALDPTHDGWMYFVATDGQDKTEFARTNAEFEKLKEKFNASSGN
ncbi:endolytic transglycosylase MltG [Streptomyces sp. NPDC047000]|uniref:endolytic transglycosylase MltG n=1 Tax=Streptomyces sp. NPDC047000 TaxID=3155474 RepID=UPI003401DD1F